MPAPHPMNGAKWDDGNIVRTYANSERWLGQVVITQSGEWNAFDLTHRDDDGGPGPRKVGRSSFKTQEEARRAIEDLFTVIE